MNYHSLEEIINEYEKQSIKVISFDIFDTLLLRPTRNESDKFGLLDKTFYELSGAGVSFVKVRTMAERILRRRIISGELPKEDITIKEIYEVMSSSLHIAPEVAEKMMQEELLLEKKLCTPRESGKKLYEAALRSGKKVVLTSDMYLRYDDIKELLLKNNFTGYDRLFVSSDTETRKMTGNLYRTVLSEMGIEAGELLHIGDNKDADIKIPEGMGINAAWLPSTMETFQSFGCAHLMEKVSRDLTDWQKASNEPGISIMLQMSANKYFDDPFRDFDSDSDYNRDPYFIGYSALGIEVLALVKWLIESAERDKAKKLLFLSRDGYLPLKVYNIIRKYKDELPEADYIHVSRIAVLPYIIRKPEDLYDLPVDLSYQTPEKILKLLEFCSLPNPVEIIFSGSGDRLYKKGNTFDEKSFIQFITDFIQKAYSSEKHEESRKHIADYMLEKASLTDDTAVFDMGYSGRITAAMKEASGKDIKVYFFHTDGRQSFRSEMQQDIRINTFLDFSPYMEASLREYAYLEPVASCIGYDEKLEPVFDSGPAEGYARTSSELQRGALDFVTDFMNIFGSYDREVAFRYHNAALPFEAFLRHTSEEDMKIFENIYIDDELWGGRRDINLLYLMKTRLLKLPEYAKSSGAKENIPTDDLSNVQNTQNIQNTQGIQNTKNTINIQNTKNTKMAHMDETDEKSNDGNESQWEQNVRTSVMRESILNWYEFRKDASVLEIITGESPVTEDSPVTGLLRRRCRTVNSISFQEVKFDVSEKYDYVVCLEALECVSDPKSFLQGMMGLLSKDGRIILSVDNRFGLRYFCGSGEKHTGIPFMGINGYYRNTGINQIGEAEGRSFSIGELTLLLKDSGVQNYKFYYPVPDSLMPQMIFTDTWKNGINAAERLNDYNYNDEKMLGIEHRIMSEMIDAGALHFLADSFLVEVSPSGELSDIDYAVVTTDRGEEYGMATTIRSSGRVYKRPLWSAGEANLKKLYSYTEELSEKGVPVVRSELHMDERGYFLDMPLVRKTGLTYWMEEAVSEDQEIFVKIFDKIFEYIKLAFSPDESGKGRTFMDLAPCNCFMNEEENVAPEDSLLFYDQEFISEDGTPEYAMYRTIKYFFQSSRKAREAFDSEKLYDRYGITPYRRMEFEEKEQTFISRLRNTKKYKWLLQASTPDYERIFENTLRLVGGGEADDENTAGKTDDEKTVDEETVDEKTSKDVHFEGKTENGKKYHIGYVPGVYDLFHTGHLRLFERCKEMCDILIVGVLTDELVEFYKGKKPVIDYENRAAVIAGLKVVDRVVPVDFNNTDKIKAWEMLHYDCHFSGDDHINHWKDVEEELRKRGSAMEFFSYTEGISSTMIKEKMNNDEQ